MLKLIPILILVLFLSMIPTSNSYSVGINDYGILVTNNGNITYGYSTSSIYGNFTFYNGSFYSTSPSNVNGFSLQLNGNINVSLNTTLWIQSIARVKKIKDLYYISFLDNIWNVTQNSSNISHIFGQGSIYYNSNKSFYAYKYPIDFLTETPFKITQIVSIISNGTYPYILFYFYFKNSTFTGQYLLDNVTIRIKSSNPLFLIGYMGGYAPETTNSLYYPFVLQYVVTGYSQGSQLIVFNFSSIMSLYYKYNNSWYSIPEAFQTNPVNYAGGITGESINPIDSINERYNGSYVIQTKGIINNTYLWVPKLTIYNYTKYYIIRTIPAKGQFNITINGISYHENNGIINITTNGNYSIKASLNADGKTIETFSYYISNAVISNQSMTNQFINEIKSLILLLLMVIIVIIAFMIFRYIKRI